MLLYSYTEYYDTYEDSSYGIVEIDTYVSHK